MPFSYVPVQFFAFLVGTPSRSSPHSYPGACCAVLADTRRSHLPAHSSVFDGLHPSPPSLPFSPRRKEKVNLIHDTSYRPDRLDRSDRSCTPFPLSASYFGANRLLIQVLVLHEICRVHDPHFFRLFFFCYFVFLTGGGYVRHGCCLRTWLAGVCSA